MPHENYVGQKNCEVYIPNASKHQLVHDRGYLAISKWFIYCQLVGKPINIYCDTCHSIGEDFIWGNFHITKTFIFIQNCSGVQFYTEKKSMRACTAPK